jgi:GT2 family glycosyltransferase
MNPSMEPGGMRFDLTVSIVVNDNRELALGCVRSVYAEAGQLAVEVIVVDNYSSDGSAEAISRTFPGVKLIRNDTKEGFSANNNKAIRAAGGEFVMLLNDDTIVHEGALEKMVTFMRENPQAGAVGAFLVNPDGSPQFTGRARPTLAAAAMISLGLHRLFPDNPVTAEYYKKEVFEGPHEVQSVNGAAMMLSRAAIEKTGLLDEGFFLFCEDVDYSLRLSGAGFMLYLIPEARITHYRGASTGGRRMVWIYHKSLMRFYRKHYAPKTFFLVNWLVYLGIGLRLAVYMMLGGVRRNSANK